MLLKTSRYCFSTIMPVAGCFGLPPFVERGGQVKPEGLKQIPVLNLPVFIGLFLNSVMLIIIL